MNKFDKKIYKANLYICNGNFSNRIKKDYSISENISILKSYIFLEEPFDNVGKILIYKSFLGYREFITDKEIPYLKMTGNILQSEKQFKLTKEEPIFIDTISCFEDNIVSLDEIRLYLEDKLNPSNYQITENYDNNILLKKYYLEKINYFFKKAWRIYDEMLEKAKYSTEKVRKKNEKNQDRKKIKALKKEYSEI